MKTAIVSTYYPSPGGVATYTKYLFEELSKIDDQIFILADKLKDEAGEENPRIIRCWDHDYRYVGQIIDQVKKNNFSTVHIQQELHIFGGRLTALLLPLLMIRLKLNRIRVIITLHGVVPLKNIDKDFLKENGYEGSPLIIKLGLKVIYSLICLFANKIVVHEKKLKDNLKSYWVKPEKASVVGHGITQPQLIDKQTAQTKLNLNPLNYTFLYFGYVTGYKGIELIIKALKKIPDQNFNFVFVGSKHPRLKKEIKYQKYYQGIKTFFQNDPRCQFSGYVAEEDVNTYFRAADCVVLPYTVQMSSSGPMALALANETLVIGSSAFRATLPDDLIFKKNSDSLVTLLNKARNHELDEFEAVIKAKKKELAWSKIAEKTLKLYQA